MRTDAASRGEGPEEHAQPGTRMRQRPPCSMESSEPSSMVSSEAQQVVPRTVNSRPGGAAPGPRVNLVTSFRTTEPGAPAPICPS